MQEISQFTQAVAAYVAEYQQSALLPNGANIHFTRADGTQYCQFYRWEEMQFHSNLSWTKSVWKVLKDRIYSGINAHNYPARWHFEIYEGYFNHHVARKSAQDAFIILHDALRWSCDHEVLKGSRSKSRM